MASDPISSWQIDWHKLQLQNLNMLAPWQNSYVKARQCFKKQRHYFAHKCPYGQSYGF